jgi:hypothetical protein
VSWPWPPPAVPAGLRRAPRLKGQRSQASGEAQESASPHHKKKLAVVCLSPVARRNTPPGKRELKPLAESV